MHPIQAMVNEMNADAQRARSTTQMTLGKLIAALEAVPPDKVVAGVVARLNSYRGYYCDLSFEPGDGCSAGDLLRECRAAMGKVFQGYKGGDFLMGESTPMWVAEYGSGGGDRIMGLNEADGSVTLILAPEDETA